jgi:hypothetical protein
MATEPKAGPPPTEPPTCSTCLFYDVAKGGICRGAPPLPSQLHGALALWALVTPEDSCKEYMKVGSAWP